MKALEIKSWKLILDHFSNEKHLENRKKEVKKENIHVDYNIVGSVIVPSGPFGYGPGPVSKAQA